MKPIPAVLVLTALALPLDSLAVERFRMDPDHTFVHFAVVHNGVSSIRGRFAYAYYLRLVLRQLKGHGTLR